MLRPLRPIGCIMLTVRDLTAGVSTASAESLNKGITTGRPITMGMTIQEASHYCAKMISSGVPSQVDREAAANAPPASALAADRVSAAVAIYRSDSKDKVTFSLDSGSPVTLSPYTEGYLSNPSPGSATSVDGEST